MQNNNMNQPVQYAGFWIRFAAYLVDGIIVMIALGVIDTLMAVATSALTDTALGGEIIFQYTLTDIVGYCFEAAYFVLITYFTGTTVGKKLLNLKVISVKENGKLSFLDVFYRETIGRYLSGVCLGIGYFMAGFNDEKKTLHDILCDTRVVEVRKEKAYVKPVAPAETAEQAEMPDMIPKMVEEPQTPEMPVETEVQPYSQEYVSEQWKQILERDS